MRVLGTGVELMLYSESHLASPSYVRWPERPTPEQRADDARVERGELIEVATSVFAELEIDGERSRWSAGVSGPARVPAHEDPTSALREIADFVRGDIGDLYGDVRRAELDVTRFEFLAAPFRIELSPQLRDALSWDERPPRL